MRDPLFVDPDGADGSFGYVDPVNDGRDDDFHLKSEYGSYTGGSLAPVLDAVTGLPVAQGGVWTNYPAEQSPGIDRGDETYDYSNEPLDNGGFINIGTYGNTAQASKSPAEYVLVLRPDGGEVWPAEQTFPIRWRSDIMDYTIHVPGNASDYYTEVITENPVGYWRLNETIASGTIANDSSAGGTNDGAYVNGVTQDVSAFLIGDSAAEFDVLDDRVLVPDDVSLNPAAITHSANSLLIGQGTGSNSYTWKGRLDEVAVYNTALTPAQVADHYNAGLGTVTEVDIELINPGGGAGYP